MRHSLNFLFILLSTGAWALANAYGPSCECYNYDICNDQHIICEPPPREKYYVQTLSESDIDMDSATSRSKQKILQLVNGFYCCRLKNIYKTHIGYLKTKYLQKQKSDFSGKVTLKFTIAPSGKTTDVSIVSSTTDYPEFDNVIKSSMQNNWIWKPIKSGETTPTIVTITFMFYIME